MRRAAIVTLYACAALQFVRYYTIATPVYLNMPAYLDGRERLPFQERILPALLIRALTPLSSAIPIGAHSKGAYTVDRAPLFVLALIGFVVAACFTQRLYRLLSRTHTLAAMVFPVFLFTMMWTYTIHAEANFAYPYDFLSVAFFSAGLCSVYTRQFLPLFLVIVIGTFNRETTLFLIALFALDATYFGGAPNRFRSLLARVPWLRLLLLLSTWLAIKLSLAHHYRGNSHAEEYIRLRENLGLLTPRLWPALLNICGYGLPVLLFFYKELRPLRFRRYLWIVPVWIGVMFFSGVIVETRVYGELCPLVAVGLVLVAERYATRTNSVAL